MTLRFASEEELAALQLREGERYLVYGRDYVDSDFLLRRNLSMGKEAVFEALDSAQVRKLTEEEIFIYNDESWLDTEAMLVARFGDRFLTQAEVDSVDSVALTVCENPLLLVGKLTFDAIDLFDSDAYMTGSLPADEYAARYQQAGILPMEGSGQAFLQTTEDPLWQQAASCIAAENHAFPIVATPALEAVAQFAMQEARITDGRGFRKEEYSDGARVCVISEFLAAKNHLSVGDKLSLQFYEPDLNLPRPTNIGQSANPTAASFSPVQGFAGEPCAFTIVGLYRQKNEWSEESYAFTPNTVFVPETSVPCKTQTGDSGIFHSLLLHNGTTAQMDAYLTESGLEGLLIYYDQGYGDIRDSLAGYYATSEKVLLLGLTAWVGMLLLYLLLFPLRQKKQLRRMWTLGATPAQMRTHLRYTNAGLLLPGGVLGAAVGALCMGAILRRVEQAGKLDAALSAPPWISLAALGLQLLLLCLLTEALARLQVRRVRTRYGRR